jgi:hypothetical protein
LGAPLGYTLTYFAVLPVPTRHGRLSTGTPRRTEGVRKGYSEADSAGYSGVLRGTEGVRKGYSERDSAEYSEEDSGVLRAYARGTQRRTQLSTQRRTQGY